MGRLKNFMRPLPSQNGSMNEGILDNFGVALWSRNCAKLLSIQSDGRKCGGVWLLNGIDLMIIAVYAPHDPRDKRMLWDYLAHVINQWQGEVVIMGDFNEVRVKSDRFGTNFNVLGANIFNSFINSTGLEEVHLGGSAFTWCHKYPRDGEPSFIFSKDRKCGDV
ncbi:RNA-directed DNA polymerase, eukaryota [Tanacetum coccineum]